MNNKKVMSVFVFSVLMISVFAGVASAAPLEDFVDGVGKVLESIFKWLIGPSAGSEELFVRVMLFILVLTIVTLAVKRIPNIGENSWVSFLISFIVSTLAIRYLLVGDILLLWLPYSTLGILITSMLPFIIVFFFLQGFDSSVIRKVGWTTFVVSFAALAALRWDALAAGAAGSGPVAGWNPAWIYLIIAVISGLLLIFDRRIHGMFAVRGYLKLDTEAKQKQAMDLAGDLRRKSEEIAEATNDEERKQKIKERENIKKNLAALFK